MLLDNFFPVWTRQNLDRAITYKSYVLYILKDKTERAKTNSNRKSIPPVNGPPCFVDALAFLY